MTTTVTILTFMRPVSYWQWRRSTRVGLETLPSMTEDELNGAICVGNKRVRSHKMRAVTSKSDFMSAFEQRMSRRTNIYIAPARLKFRPQGRKIPELIEQKGTLHTYITFAKKKNFF